MNFTFKYFYYITNYIDEYGGCLFMNPIEQNAHYILKVMVDKKIQSIGGRKINEETDLNPQEINDAVDYLEEMDFVKVLNALGTSPYDFANITINSKGKRFYYDQLE